MLPHITLVGGFLRQLVDIILWQFDYNCPIKFTFNYSTAFILLKYSHVYNNIGSKFQQGQERSRASTIYKLIDYKV
jgi:hypothetical protein